MKIAGAPISWGVCEVPGWGHQLDAHRVLSEMRDVGLSATELGPEGFLPSDPAELTALLDSYKLRCVGSFVPVLLHDDDYDPQPDIAGPLDALVACGAEVLVLAAATGTAGYDARPALDRAQWATLLANLDRLAAVAADRGVLAVLHPHVGTMVETRGDVDRVLEGSAIKLCLDTGHLLIGGTDPLHLARSYPDRIAHAHLKDVDSAIAARVQAGQMTYTEAVREGMYTPLGGGDIDIAGIVTSLRSNGFDGWFVMEQDTILAERPADEGPVRDVRTSVAYMHDACARISGMSLRIGVLGASRIAEAAIVGPAEELGYRLVAVAARDPLRARSFADKYGVERVLASYDEVINDPEVDAIYNPLANSLHAPWNLAAIAAGKPVLAEKPFARNHDEAQQVAEAADAAGVTVMEGFHYLFTPVTRRAFQLARDGTLGDITRVEVRMVMPAPDSGDPRWSLDLAGGALMDLGCYGLHVMRQLGDVSIAAARAVENSPGVDASCDVEVALGNGATGMSINSMVAEEHSHTLTIAGTEGDVLVHDFIKPSEDDRVTIRTSAGTTVENLGTRPSYTYQLEAFGEHVLKGAPLPLDNLDAVQNMALVDAAYRAAGMSPR